MSLKRDPSKYFSNETIIAVATGFGGAIAVIRVSGSKSVEFISSLSRSSKKLQHKQAEKKTLFRVDGTSIDEVVVLYFKGPNSYTGEDVVEIFIHGNPIIAEEIILEAANFNIRQALPGEFSFRSVKNGKYTLSQAQAVLDLLQSTNKKATQLALEKLSGTQNFLISSLSDELRQVATLSELSIDFSDQDIEELSTENLSKKIKFVLDKLIHLSKSFTRGVAIQEGIKTAILGSPNVGKSSFFNALLGEERAIVSDIPGTTRDTIRETISLSHDQNSITFKIEDTAGIRSTEDQIEKMGIDRSFRAAENADLILLLISSDTFNENTKNYLNSSLIKKTIVVITKTDLLSDQDKNLFENKIKALFPAKQCLLTSAVRGVGIHEVAQEMIKKTSNLFSREKNEVVLTRVEQFNAVNDAINHLQRAVLVTQLDLMAADIRQALSSLEPLIGQTVTDDILGRIFSQFCIGK